jgi:rsbT co-antagonist protein RsbR
MRHLAKPDPAGMKDWWDVYEAHYDVLQAALLERVRALPGLDAVLRRMTPAQLAEQSAAARADLRQAVEGNWEPLFQSWRKQGPSYAAADVPFGEWFQLLASFQQLLLPELIRVYSSDPGRLAGALAAMMGYTDLAMAGVGDAYLNAKERIIAQQQHAIHELSTPVLQVREQLLLLPIVGLLDTHRARQLTEALLHAVRAHRAKVVVVDITGVAAVDSKVASHLFQALAAVKLMGATSIITGLSADVAQALVVLGVDVAKLNTAGDLQGGLEEANRLLGVQVTPRRPPASPTRDVADWSDGHAGADSQAG